MSTDADIIRRAGEDPRAFTELFDRHARAIAGFAIRRVGADAADDVVSETFLVAYRKRATFRADATSALPWLFAIAAREVRKLRAKEISHLRAVAAGAPEQTVDGAVDADERIDAMRRLRAIAPQLERLAPRDRETLLLYAWGDLTYEQIAETLRVPVGTVRSRLNRVRRKLTAVRPGSGDMAAYTMGEGA